MLDIERVGQTNRQVYGADKVWRQLNREGIVVVFARYVVGWRVSRSMYTDFVLDALAQALYARQPARDEALIHHSQTTGPPRIPGRLSLAQPLPRSRASGLGRLGGSTGKVARRVYVYNY